jgi:uncharacterized protein (TIGR00290 family)
VKERVVFCWSGGKDSALALHRLRQDPHYEIVALLTTCTQVHRRVSMHGVRIELAQQQAGSIGLPLDLIYLSERPANGEYEGKMAEYLRSRRDDGVAAVAFGDIFLEDLRNWREKNLARIGLRGIYPLWKENTRALVEEFLTLGFGTVVCCVDDAYFEEDAVGRIVDRGFIDSLPSNVDPCGENGEFHSFAFEGPIFSRSIPFTIGEKVYKPLDGVALSTPTKGFWFCDLEPV